MGILLGTCIREQGPFGWSSNYFFSGMIYEDILQVLDLVNTAELKMLPNSVKCRHIKVSDVEIVGDVLAKVPSQGNGTYTDPVIQSEGCDPTIAFAITFYAGVAHRARHFLRGLPSEKVTGKDRLTIKWTDTSWGQWLTDWQQLVMGSCVLAQRPGKRQGPAWGTAQITKFDQYFASAEYPLSIRRAGRPFGLPRGRRMVA